MLKHHYPALFATDPAWRERAATFAAKVHELTSFLHDVRGLRAVPARFEGSVTYHDSCSGLRELGVRDQPRRLLKSVAGLSLAELPDADVCCGFGGTFCVKYPDISNRMVGEKVGDAAATGARLLLAGDLGCLMNMAGKASREGRSLSARHVVEVLAGMAAGPAIGEGEP
jgi:L-lactate dehydrogenase complex protein LldE